ncbi:hypothetical protein A33Q_4047 [Indibacter alkaliphilus LW1]|uniref:Uncharacterized protein n=1 Tax=Indibacter alkaliphilus (strain CCUG 57479 / KCTC 22604 / LW1) TaxID=1189612 RepID=S2CZB0_INDAL|nr:hypothetical protein A33Q_4047 [Indibacter alkaliphilus LW1]
MQEDNENKRMKKRYSFFIDFERVLTKTQVFSFLLRNVNF